MKKSTMPTAAITQNYLDSIANDLAWMGAGDDVKKPRKNAPRFYNKAKRISKTRAIAIRDEKIIYLIKDAQREIESLMSQPLQTHEYEYVKAKPGTRAWKRAGVPFVYSLVCSKKTSKQLLKKP